jgi:hypothetical protein
MIAIMIDAHNAMIDRDMLIRALEFPPSESGLGNSQVSREFQQIPWEFPESRTRGLSGCWH